MKLRNQFGAFALILAALVGCGSGSREDAAASSAVASDAPAAEAKAAAPSSKAQTASLIVGRREVVRRAEVGIRVEKVEKSQQAVNRIVAEAGGYVESASSTDLSSTKPSFDMTLRVPVDRFEPTIARLEALGTRLSERINSEDVTSQIVDLDARMKTLAAEEETYRGLLRQATRLDNVIQLQDKLTEVRSTIESMAAQRKSLAGLASLSTITLHLEQGAVANQPDADPGWLAQTWGDSTTQLGGAIRAATQVAIWIAVFSPFWAPALLILRWSIRRQRAVRATPPRIQI